MQKIIKAKLPLASLFFLILFFCTNCDFSKKKSYVVGLVNPNEGTWSMVEGFVDGMAEHGFVAGENISYLEVRSKESLDTGIDDLVKKNVDLIFTVTTPATKAAKKATEGTRIPVVFSLHDPVHSQIVKDMSRPEGNLTGVQIRGSTPKAVEWLTAIDPGLKNIYVPIAYDTKAATQSVKDIKNSASKLDLEVTVAEVETVDDLKAALSSIPKDVGGIFIGHSILVASNIDLIIDRAIELKIPVGSGLEEHFERITISYAPDNIQLGKQASRLAAKILNGSNPADLPVEVAEFFLVINLKTALESSLEIPNDLLVQADQIIR